MTPRDAVKTGRLNETQRFLLLAILIGVFSGLLVTCFHIVIDLLGWYSLGALSEKFRFGRLISPALGALVATFLATRVFPAARGSGVNQTKAALYISDGYVPASTVIGKFAACSIAIGSGNSLGPEDPSLQMGAGVASLLGRVFRLGRKNMRMIAPVGAAAGIAAAFNTPITGVIFVMEEVVAAWNAGVVGSTVLAAVSSVVVVRWFLGNEPLFRVPSFSLESPSELVIYAAIGVAGGLLSALFIKLIEILRGRLERLARRNELAEALIGGVCVGIAGLWVPQVMGAGYDAVDSALHGQFRWEYLLILAGLKLVVTLLCFGAGVPGGMFAPALFMGAMLGGGLGGMARHYWGSPTSAAGVRTGRHGNILRGRVPRAHDFDFHGVRNQRELRDYSARDDRQHDLVFHLPQPASPAVLHHAGAAGRCGPAFGRGVPHHRGFARRGCHAAAAARHFAGWCALDLSRRPAGHGHASAGGFAAAARDQPRRSCQTHRRSFAAGYLPGLRVDERSGPGGRRLVR